jgi:hypothetical protein
MTKNCEWFGGIENAVVNLVLFTFQPLTLFRSQSIDQLG